MNKSQKEIKSTGFSQRKQLNVEETGPKCHYVRWSAEQNVDYAIFLQKNYFLQKDKEERRNSKFFIKMSKELKNGRDNHQCRSHHVKLLQRYSTVQRIIEQLLIDSKKKTEVSQVTQSEGSEEIIIERKERKERNIFFQDLMDKELNVEPVPLLDFLSGPRFYFSV